MSTRSIQFPAHGRKRAKRRFRRTGSTLVEFALVGTFLFIPMMMGIMEFGVLVKNNLLVANAVREGARAAATGKTTVQIRDRVKNFIAPMNISTACNGAMSSCGTIEMLYSTDEFITSQLLGDTSAASGSNNNAPHGSLVRVMVSTRHKPLTSFFFFLNRRNIVTTVTMRRE
ncbi:MAG TPA: TadE/TadG family type IV pilus assembly protein [Abditibacteriaceae bacterium]|jgi:Flp pilus assembly protein TadG